MKLEIESIKTSQFTGVEDLIVFICAHLGSQNLEGAILAISSKIVSLAEKRTVNRTTISKRDLVLREADQYLCEGGYGVELTIKHGILIPAAGIDESNSPLGDYILFPENPYRSAETIYLGLKQKLRLQTFGVVITDSHVLPLRKGVTGIGLSHWGFKATRELSGRSDLFGRELRFTSVDVLDAVSGMAVYAMGESNESTPLAVVRGAEVEFTESSSSDEISIAPELDLFAPLLLKS